MKISFYGAAGNVTGSCYLLEHGSGRILVDCGLYQERQLVNRNWDAFPFIPAEIDAVVLSHAHLDHCGLLPRLFAQGFKGRVICTSATADITEIILYDSARLQAEDVAFKRKRHKREGREGPYPYQPLYEEADVDVTVANLERVAFHERITLTDGLSVIFREAGHILGSGSPEISYSSGGSMHKIVFSGDVGRWDVPLIRDPELITGADYIVMESTYGNRVHKPNEDIPENLARIINQAHRAGGKVIVPSFAVERAQELLYHLNNLLNEERIPALPVFLDSPMAIRVTDLFRKHAGLLDSAAAEMIANGRRPCDFKGLQLCRTRQESQAINELEGPAVIIAGSGMCTGGRIKHHLARYISRRENTVLFVGYQAFGTLGRHLVNGAEKVRIHGREHHVDARIEKINGFSAHADRNELLRWLSGIEDAPETVFVTHGEPAASDEFANILKWRNGWKTKVPAYRETVELV